MKNIKKVLASLLLVIVLASALIVVSKVNKTRSVKVGEEYNPKGEAVVISIDEYGGWNGLLIANGGLITTTDSINAKNGIKIKYVVENDATVSSDKLISGEYQGAGYTVNRYAFLQNKFDKANVPTIMPYITNYSNGGDGIIATSDITSVEDLVGKKIAVPQHSEAQTLIEWLLKNSSLTDEQVKTIRKNMVFYNTADETADAFFAGEVDAAATWEPYLTEALSSTESRILFDTSMATNLVMTGIVFNQEFAENHQEFMEKMIDGALQSRETYLKDFNGLRQMPAFKLASDEELYEMCNYASLATYADNMSVLNSTCKNVYKDMAEIWLTVGEKATPERAEEVFTDKYMSLLKGKYDEDDFTTFAFSADGRKAAENIANNSALLKVTLNVEFEADSAKIKSSSYEDLKEFAEVAKLLNGTYIQIEGNTAKVEGTDGVEFSKKRATSVAKYLHRLGVDYDRFIIVGNGDKNPIASNSTEEGKQKNRRTEVFFKVTGY